MTQINRSRPRSLCTAAALALADDQAPQRAPFFVRYAATMCHCLAAIALGLLSALSLSGCAGQPGKSQDLPSAGTSDTAKSHGLQLLGTSGRGREVYYTSPERMSSYLVTIVVFVPPGSSLEEIVGDPANSGVLVFDCHGGFAPSFGEPTMLIPHGSVVEALEAAICRPQG